MKYLIFSLGLLSITSCNKCKECYLVEEVDGNKSEISIGEYCGDEIDQKETGKIGSLQTPRPQYWFDVALGKSGIHLSNTFNTWENIIGVRVYISNKVADKWLPYFESHKEDIETKIG